MKKSNIIFIAIFLLLLILNGTYIAIELSIKDSEIPQEEVYEKEKEFYTITKPEFPQNKEVMQLSIPGDSYYVWGSDKIRE